jgi:hypothetical protein
MLELPFSPWQAAHCCRRSCGTSAAEESPSAPLEIAAATASTKVRDRREWT